MLFKEAPRPPEFRDKPRAAETESIAGARSLLARHPEVRVFATATAARLVVGTIESLVHRCYTSDEPPNPDDMERFECELVAMLARYLRVE